MAPRSRYTSLANLKPTADTRSCWYMSKVVLRAFSIVLSGGLIGVAVHVTVKYSREFDWTPDLIYYVVPIAGFLILWDVAEFATACARKGRGIHPGAHVGVQLLAWIALGIDAGLVLRATYRLGRDDLKDYHEFDWYRVALKVCTGLLAVLSLIRFVLFVAACFDTHHRRHWWKKQILVQQATGKGGDESAVHLVGSQVPGPMPYNAGYSGGGPSTTVVVSTPGAARTYYDGPK